MADDPYCKGFIDGAKHAVVRAKDIAYHLGVRPAVFDFRTDSNRFVAAMMENRPDEPEGEPEGEPGDMLDSDEDRAFAALRAVMKAWKGDPLMTLPDVLEGVQEFLEEVKRAT